MLPSGPRHTICIIVAMDILKLMTLKFTNVKHKHYRE